MRLAPIITALVASAVLYGLVIERERLFSLVGRELTGQVSAMSTASGDAEQKGEATDKASTDSAEGLVRVLAIRSVARNVDDSVVLSGRTEATRVVDLRSETSGPVMSEPLKKGAFVERGQIICEIDAGARESALAEAEARMVEAQANLTISTKLVKEGFASETKVVADRAALKTSEAAVERASLELKRLRIAAPFDGLLESDAAEIGSLLQPGSLCARIVQLNPIRLVGFVSESKVDHVKVGYDATAKLINGQSVSGKVSYVSRSADSATRTFRLEVEVQNEDLFIRDGNTVEISIVTKSERGHFIPQSALTLNDEGQLGVRTVANDRANFSPVRVIRDTVDGVWIAGLPDRTDIIVAGQEFVKKGSHVLVTYKSTVQ
ncbi:MAG: efflux RND transporter periplasmic adaptor subunit [Albidovulum sp.]|nr:efflux RND transporter periplasmic adaptor subunit [Albidovulum sp.]MDE0306957.1 efflux RND transporter periplasmic adaptor subunit [Albidovulum sp.]